MHRALTGTLRDPNDLANYDEIWPRKAGGFVSVVVITCASHAQGRRFEPGTKQYFFLANPR